MELRHLRYFIMVAEERHFTRAAARLNMQQPPLSQQIRALEQELGFDLFKRHPKGVDLTAGGMVFLEEARAILARVEQGSLKAARAAQGIEGTLIIAFTSSAAAHPLIPRIIRAYREHYPGVELSINEGSAREVTEDYELRACLEPEALRQSAPNLDRDLLQAMLQRVLDAQESAHCSLEEIEQIEEDLHQHCLAGLQNRKIAALIRQGQSPMIISRIFYRLLGIGADPAMLAEHRLILELLLHGAFDAAALNLREHLQRARQRMLQRLKVLSVLPEQPLPAYLHKLS